MNYTEPVKENVFQFEMIDRDALRMGDYQRDYSSALAKKLINSIDKGFINPLIVVQDESQPGTYEVIDGQHRLQALDMVGKFAYVPAIVVPGEFKDYPLFYNIEKTDNIKDKAAKLHALYMDKMKAGGQTEKDIIPAANYEGYLFTVAISFCEYGLKSPSLVEPPIKKLDKYYLVTTDEEGYRTPMPLDEAYEIRQLRASALARLEQIVNETAEDYGVRDFNLKRAIVSKSSQALWGNARKIDEEPEDALPALSEQITMMDWSWMEGR